jgi:hypothetical protein
MRGGSTLYILALGLLTPGCALICNGVRVAWQDLAETVDDCREHRRNRNWAEAAWAEVSCVSAAEGHSVDYADGFKDGFTGYLDHGGEGEPPLVAPARYRRFRYQTSQGYHAIEDWFAGYRHGVAVARQTDSRRWITGPVGLPPLAPHGPGTVIDHGPAGGLAPTEILPAPRTVPFQPADGKGRPAAEEPLPAPRLGAPQAPPSTPDAGKSPEEQPPTGQGQPSAEEELPAPRLGAPQADSMEEAEGNSATRPEPSVQAPQREGASR